MRALGYFRLKDGEQASLQEMERAFEDYCRLNLHQPIDTFGSVGEEKGQAPSEYHRMTGYIEESSGGFLVVVPSAAHLGSDLESVSRSIIELDRMGAKTVCWDEEFPDVVQNSFQTLGVKGVSSTRSRRIKESMRARASQGQALGRPPFGYRIGSDGWLAVHKDEAAVVELIYRLYTKDGLGFRLIAQHLNERGITTRRGGNWSVVSIRDILRNAAYTGTYSRLGMRKPRVHDAIVPAEVFRTAQDLTKSRRPIGRVANPEPFLLSGLLYCSYCGNKMLGVTRRQSWRRKDGRRASQAYRYYQCQSRNNQSVCGYHTWRTSRLEGAVLDQLRYALMGRGSQHASDGAGDTSRGNEIQAIREQRVRNAERLFVKALKRVARGEVSLKVLGEYLKELDGARRAATGVDRPSDVDSALDRWDSLDFDARRSFLVDHIARVTVEDDSVKVVV